MRALKIVVDANIVAAGFVAKAGSSSHNILRHWRTGIFDIVFSGTLIEEIAATLDLLGAGENLVIEVVDALCSDPDLIVAIKHQKMGCRDANDDHILETAVTASAAIIVSRDRDLLDLPTHVEDMLRDHGVRIMSDVQFLRWIQAQVFSPLVYLDFINLDEVTGPGSDGGPEVCPCFERAVTV